MGSELMFFTVIAVEKKISLEFGGRVTVVDLVLKLTPP